MKKFVSVLLSALMVLSLAGCSGETLTTEIGDYPLDNEVVTQILVSNGFDLNAYVSRYDDTDKTGYTYSYTIDNFDENYEYEGEPSVYGILQLEWDGEDGKCVNMICMEDESEFADISNYDNIRKSVYVACDVYGGIENKQQIADDFISAIKDGAMFEEALPQWDAEYNGVYVHGEFLPSVDDAPVTFREFEIYDQTRKQWYDGRYERAIQIIVDMNPYMYTLEEINHPAGLTKEQANNIISDNQWNFVVSEVIDEAQTAGVKRHLYYLTADTGEQVGTVGIIYNKSGKLTGFSYNISNTDAYLSSAGVEFAVKAACDFYGGVEDIDGLADKVITALANKTFEYNQYGDPHCLIEHNGMYCLLNFGAKTPKVYEFTGLNLYDKDSLQAGIYTAIKNDDWYKKIYTELFE